jgi:trehalose-phosphatase
MTAQDKASLGTPVIPLFSEYLPSLMEDFKRKNVFLFLDYDGTLTPIVSDPASAFLHDDMRDVLCELVDLYPVSIVTGRGRPVISDFLGSDLLPKVSLAASHGFDIHLKNGEFLHVSDHAHQAQFMRFKCELARALSRFPAGCALEENKYSVTVHYRHTEAADHPAVERCLDELLMGFPGLVKRGGKMVFEARLDIEWNKGKAVEWILSKTCARDPNDCLVVYIGDDMTDEDAFAAIKHYTSHVSVIVSADENIGRPTAAEYRMRDQSDVMKFLKNLIELKLNNTCL